MKHFLLHYYNKNENIVMRLTIKHIAQKAKVSTATVSRVVNNVDLNKVSKATRKRVLQIIDKNKYYPDMVGLSLVTGKKNIIGFSLPSHDFLHESFYFSEILRGALMGLNEGNYKLLLLTCDLKGTMHYLNVIRSKATDGIILVGTMIDDPLIEKVREENIPFVLVSNYTKDREINYVDSDNISGAYSAVEYLIRLGHRRIAVINGSITSRNAMDRFQGYKKALAQYKIGLREEYIKYGNYTYEKAYEFAKELFELKEYPTAIFAAEDAMALAAARAASEKGLRVPQDVSLIGFDNSPTSRFAYPALTSVDHHISQIGYEAAKMLINKIKSKNKMAEAKKIIDTKLVVRESCAEAKNKLF